VALEGEERAEGALALLDHLHELLAEEVVAVLFGEGLRGEVGGRGEGEEGGGGGRGGG
jgi:hypothetical protein